MTSLKERRTPVQLEWPVESAAELEGSSAAQEVVNFVAPKEGKEWAVT